MEQSKRLKVSKLNRSFIATERKGFEQQAVFFPPAIQTNLSKSKDYRNSKNPKLNRLTTKEESNSSNIVSG